MKNFIDFASEVSENFALFSLGSPILPWNEENGTYPCLECFCYGMCNYQLPVHKIADIDNSLDSEWEDGYILLSTCQSCHGLRNLNFHSFYKYYLYYCDQEKEKRKNMFEITSENFEKEVLQHKGKLMLKFGADWCAPCKMLEKTISSLDSSIDIRVVSVNIENSPELAQKYQISSIPCSLFFNNGEMKEKKIGMMREQDIISIVNRI